MADTPRGINLSENLRGPTGPTGPRALRGYTGPTGPGIVSESFYYSDTTDYPLTNIDLTEPFGGPGQYRPHWASTTPSGSLTADIVGGTYLICAYCEWIATTSHTGLALARLYDPTLGEILAQMGNVPTNGYRPIGNSAISPAYTTILNSGAVGTEAAIFSPIAIQELDPGVHVWSLQYTTIPDQIPPSANHLLRVRGQRITALKIG